MMKKCSMDCSLPFELIYEILSWVPGKQLLRFKCVSKSCYDLINDPKFIKVHLARSLKANSGTTFFFESFSPRKHIYSFRSNYHMQPIPYYPDLTPLCYPDVIKKARPIVERVEGSCHGLVCFTYILDEGPLHLTYLFLIYNPTTRASKKLPESIIPEDSHITYHPFILGFGYDCVSDDYKVLSTTVLRYRHGGANFGQKSLLYSLKTNAWESVENPPWDVSFTRSQTSFVNNSFHWLHHESKEIKCFDLSTRKYYEIPLPCRNSSKLTVFKGQLCVVTDCCDIWILKEYGNNKSWTQLFRNASQLNTIISRFLSISSSELVCIEGGCNNFMLLVTPSTAGVVLSPVLICCDIESETIWEIKLPKDFPRYMGLGALQPWVESLVPLH